MMTLDNREIISDEKANILKQNYLMETFPFSEWDFSKISNKNLFINFKFKSEIKKCNFLELNLHNTSFSDDVFMANLKKCKMSNSGFTGQKDKSITVEKVNFEKSDLRNICLSDAKFINCDFSHSDLKYAFCKSAKFINCTFHHTNLSYTIFSDCKFHSCKILFSDFEESKLENVKFKNCILVDVNWKNLKEPNIILDGGIFYDPKNSNEFVNLRSQNVIQLKNHPYFKTETDGVRFKKESKFKIEPLIKM